MSQSFDSKSVYTPNHAVQGSMRFTSARVTRSGLVYPSLMSVMA